MALEAGHIKIKMSGSVSWPLPDEMRAKLRELWASYQTLEGQEMLRAVDTMTDADVLEAYKTAMAG